MTCWYICITIFEKKIFLDQKSHCMNKFNFLKKEKKNTYKAIFYL